MRPKEPLCDPLQVTQVDGEVVFLGGGAVNFSMTVPAARETLRLLSEALDAPALPVVLLVEDEPLIRELGAAALQEAGYAVIEAECAAEALTALEAGHEVRLLFTDIQLPGALDGLELARQVSRRWPTVRVLVCSGRVRPSAKELPPHAAFLPKPYIAAEMLRRVDELTTV